MDFFIPLAPVILVDVLGSALMILFTYLCFTHALALKRREPKNVMWTYMLWFSSALFLFSLSRSGGHLVKHLLIFTGQEQYWLILRPITGSLNTLTFILVGGVTLFFSRIYTVYLQMSKDRAAIEEAHKNIRELNVKLEKMVEERTQELSISEKKYRRVFEGSKDMLIICDSDARILDINRFGVELLGFDDCVDILGLNFLEFVHGISETQLHQEIKTKDFVKDKEIKLRKKNGELLDVLFSAVPQKEDRGRHVGFEATIKDITLRKAMEQQLLRADKLASLGQLSAGVAHEINNPLGLILGYTQLLLKDTEKGTQMWEDLKVIEKHAMNCKKIVEDLLKFSRSTQTTKARYELNKLLAEVVEVVETNFQLDNVKVVKRFSPDLPPITVDPDKMRQVFMNLLMNAKQAMEDGGTITVSTSYDSNKDLITISIKDTGIGIRPEIIHKIFDPFFTTKPTGMGTGLGLSVSYGIVKDHEGEIQVDSTPGKGSTFKIILPVQNERKLGEE